MGKIMDQGIKRRWAAKLLSGEYKKGKGRLHQISPTGKHAFCCLGVLCELYNEEHPDQPLLEFHGETHVFYNGSAAYLPDEVRTWAGLDYFEARNLADMNDGRGFNRKRASSFRELANYIKKHY